MKPSPLRHPVAVLRHIIGEPGKPMYQKEFAEMAGCSRVYIQKVEQTPEHGGQKLGQPLAKRIAHETGISIKWLLNADPSASAIDESRNKYTRENFLRHRARKMRAGPYDESGNAVSSLCGYGVIRATLKAAKRKGDAEIAGYKIDRALRQIAEEFGANPNPFDGSGPVLIDTRRFVDEDLGAIESAMRFAANERKRSKRSSQRLKRA
jgi:transcriptional regulator with XRE-family HTH domain